MSREQHRSIVWGLFWSGLLAVAIFVGSRNLRHIDAALVGYTFACLFATFGITYRYAMWLQRPPTRLYWRRGWQAFLEPGHALGERQAPRPAGSSGMFALNGSSSGAAGRAGWRTCSSCGAASWPRPSPSRWSSAGSTSRPCPATCRTYRTFVFGFPTVRLPVTTRSSASSSSTGWSGRRSWSSPA